MIYSIAYTSIYSIALNFWSLEFHSSLSFSSKPSICLCNIFPPETNGLRFLGYYKSCIWFYHSNEQDGTGMPSRKKKNFRFCYKIEEDHWWFAWDDSWSWLSIARKCKCTLLHDYMNHLVCNLGVRLVYKNVFCFHSLKIIFIKKHAWFCMKFYKYFACFQIFGQKQWKCDFNIFNFLKKYFYKMFSIKPNQTFSIVFSFFIKNENRKWVKQTPYLL